MQVSVKKQVNFRFFPSTIRQITRLAKACRITKGALVALAVDSFDSATELAKKQRKAARVPEESR